jgi:hypothetical protein
MPTSLNYQLQQRKLEREKDAVNPSVVKAAATVHMDSTISSMKPNN